MGGLPCVSCVPPLPSSRCPYPLPLSAGRPVGEASGTGGQSECVRSPVKKVTNNTALFPPLVSHVSLVHTFLRLTWDFQGWAGGADPVNGKEKYEGKERAWLPLGWEEEFITDR